MPRKPHLISPEHIRQAETLRALREANLITVTEMAVRMEISTGYYSNIEAGRKRLTPALARRAAAVLGCRPIALLRPDEFEAVPA